MVLQGFTVHLMRQCQNSVSRPAMVISHDTGVDLRFFPDKAMIALIPFVLIGATQLPVCRQGQLYLFHRQRENQIMTSANLFIFD